WSDELRGGAARCAAWRLRRVAPRAGGGRGCPLAGHRRPRFAWLVARPRAHRAADQPDGLVPEWPGWRWVGPVACPDLDTGAGARPRRPGHLRPLRTVRGARGAGPALRADGSGQGAGRLGAAVAPRDAQCAAAGGDLAGLPAASRAVGRAVDR